MHGRHVWSAILGCWSSAISEPAASRNRNTHSAGSSSMHQGLTLRCCRLHTGLGALLPPLTRGPSRTRRAGMHAGLSNACITL